MKTFVRFALLLALPLTGFIAGGCARQLYGPHRISHPSGAGWLAPLGPSDQIRPDAKPNPLRPEANLSADALFSQFGNESDVGARLSLLQQAIAAAPRLGWQKCAEALAQCLKPFEYQMFLSAWSQQNGAEAFAHVKAQGTPTMESDLKAITRLWVTVDPQGAFQAVRNDSQLGPLLLPDLLEAMAGTDPAAAEAALLGIDPGLAAVAASQVVPLLAGQSPHHLAAFLNRVPGDEAWLPVRSACYALMAHDKLASDPPVVKEWAGRHLGDDAFVAGALPAITGSLKAEDSLAWLQRLPIGASMVESLGLQVLSQWMETDSLAASRWIASNPTCSFYDSAAAQTATAIAMEDPEGARTWARSIVAPERREDLLQALSLMATAAPSLNYR